MRKIQLETLYKTLSESTTESTSATESAVSDAQVSLPRDEAFEPILIAGARRLSSVSPLLSSPTTMGGDSPRSFTTGSASPKIMQTLKALEQQGGAVRRPDYVIGLKNSLRQCDQFWMRFTQTPAPLALLDSVYTQLALLDTVNIIKGIDFIGLPIVDKLDGLARQQFDACFATVLEVDIDAEQAERLTIPRGCYYLKRELDYSACCRLVRDLAPDVAGSATHDETKAIDGPVERDIACVESGQLIGKAQKQQAIIEATATSIMKHFATRQELSAFVPEAYIVDAPGVIMLSGLSDFRLFFAEPKTFSAADTAMSSGLFSQELKASTAQLYSLLKQPYQPFVDWVAGAPGVSEQPPFRRNRFIKQHQLDEKARQSLGYDRHSGYLLMLRFLLQDSDASVENHALCSALAPEDAAGDDVARTVLPVASYDFGCAFSSLRCALDLETMLGFDARAYDLSIRHLCAFPAFDDDSGKPWSYGFQLDHYLRVSAQLHVDELSADPARQAKAARYIEGMMQAVVRMAMLTPKQVAMLLVAADDDVDLREQLHHELTKIVASATKMIVQMRHLLSHHAYHRLSEQLEAASLPTKQALYTRYASQCPFSRGQLLQLSHAVTDPEISSRQFCELMRDLQTPTVLEGLSSTQRVRLIGRARILSKVCADLGYAPETGLRTSGLLPLSLVAASAAGAGAGSGAGCADAPSIVGAMTS